MDFEEGHLYHVYNQGNNRQKIFFKKENYHFFLKKIREQILPHADVLAWCLMPNHFHLLLAPRQDSRSATLSRAPTSTPTSSAPASQQLNQSIGILLASYTRAIQKQEGFSGSLFRQKTKAQCLTKADGITPSYLNTTFGASITMQTPVNEYPNVCFNYIHQNPVKANLVAKPEDWEFSSYRDYCGLSRHSSDDSKSSDESKVLVNLKLAKEIFSQVLYSSDDSKSSDELFNKSECD